jgi:hypothetical protein
MSGSEHAKKTLVLSVGMLLSACDMTQGDWDALNAASHELAASQNCMNQGGWYSNGVCTPKFNPSSRVVPSVDPYAPAYAPSGNGGRGCGGVPCGRQTCGVF